ncbi:Cytokinin dehydrogenase [Thalictrum thalictroides]|uniref:cytokinin dehydrogenase n=1 Tax=Thalictrum thalictroides TaxID=46969 RepID=A0A7J6WJL0_THATH|nr:Cytokinin dehydrogenase [Thalictrum thalictroides]
MELALFCTRVNFLVFLLALSSPCKFIQSPMDFGPLKLLQATNSASLDFGRLYSNTPSAVLRPQSPEEISLLLSLLSASSFSKVTVAAKGAGHSINGQAQALNGIVIEMDSLPSSIKIHRSVDGEFGPSYADVSGGTLWVELLKETLKVGLTPRSWTDYLYLSIGGTLSNGGISGQTFKYGPQISNVLQLDVVTGSGELVTCSPSKNSDLFFAVLGGLGQFGIITSARILLQEAPHKVKWVRAFYDDFEDFIKDQELLVVSMRDKVDYVEGFIVLNEGSLHSSSLAFPASLSSIAPQLFPQSTSSHKHYYCLEFAIYYHSEKEAINLDQISRKMKFKPSLVHSVEVAYFDFLNRVNVEEVNLRRRNLWNVAHPWLNMFVPKTGISKFRDLMLQTISASPTFEGPILLYPILKDKWNSRTSAVLPESEDNVIYIVGMLRSANPSTCSEQCLEFLLHQNREIVKTATHPEMGIAGKQYLPHYTQEEQWRAHFGGKWQRFMARKTYFDPLNILSPGQAIFKRKYSKSRSSSNVLSSQ